MGLKGVVTIYKVMNNIVLISTQQVKKLETAPKHRKFHFFGYLYRLFFLYSIQWDLHFGGTAKQLTVFMVVLSRIMTVVGVTGSGGIHDVPNCE